MDIITVFVFCITITKKIYGARPKQPRCLSVNRIAWRYHQPYTSNTTSNGIIEKLFNISMRSCCIGDLIYNTSYEFNSQHDLSEMLMQENLKTSFEFILPVSRDAGSSNYLVFPFVPLVVSPGYALFSVPQKQGGQAIFHSIKGIIPFLILMSICVGIAGTVYWMIENMTLAWYGIQPERFSEGIINGIWWAFVTMTTVGYGDKVPKTKPGRVFSVLWVFVGLVFCGFTISSITTGILVSMTKKEIELMNQNVAVIRGSEEYKYVSKKQGIPFEFDSIQEIAESLHTKTVKIALIDTMVAGYYKDILKEFELNKIIESLSAVGIIFVNDGSKFAKCVRNFIFDRQQEVLNEISKNVEVIVISKSSGKTVLIDPSLPMFRIGLLSMSGTLIFFIICGVSKDWYVKCMKKYRETKGEEVSMKELRTNHRNELIETFSDLKSVCETFIFEVENK